MTFLDAFASRVAPLLLRSVAALLLAAGGCAGDLAQPERFTGAIPDGGPVGDDDDDDDDMGGGCPDAIDVQVLLEDTCGSSVCHEGDGAGGGVDLISAGVAARTVDVPAMGADGCVPSSVLIDSMNVDDSYLLEKLDGSPPECGDEMPLFNPTLTDEEFACVRDWAVTLIEESR